ncbi:MAG: F0F1 ATP synthase subunit beta, partial [Propionibacteriaceae bacterium]
MTATVEENKTETTPGSVGRVARVIGPVVDVEFPAGEMPDLMNALLVDTTIGGTTRTMTMEVALHVGDNMVRAIALKPTDGMVRGAEVRDTGAPISVPVGDVTKGHVWDVTGNVLDVDPSTVEIKEIEGAPNGRWPIHRHAPRFDELESKTEMLETGIKVL